MSFISNLGKISLGSAVLGPLDPFTVMGGLAGFRGDKSSADGAPPNSFGISSGDKNYAAKTNAAIRRADWERYKSQVRPIEDRLISQYNNPELRQMGIQGARDQVAKAFQNSGNAFEDRLSSYGLTLSPQQRQSYERQQNLAFGLADVNAGNRANRAFENRDQQIMTGGGQRYGLQGA